MKKIFLMFLAQLSRGDIRVGIRHFISTGKAMFFLNTPMRFLKPEKFKGVRKLHELAKKLRRPIAIYSWFRDEYGTSDGAGWGEIGVIIRPDSTEAELLQAMKKMREDVSAFVVLGRDGDLIDMDPIKL